jgi:hypothetical protein
MEMTELLGLSDVVFLKHSYQYQHNCTNTIFIPTVMDNNVKLCMSPKFQHGRHEFEAQFGNLISYIQFFLACYQLISECQLCRETVELL